MISQKKNLMNKFYLYPAQRKQDTGNENIVKPMMYLILLTKLWLAIYLRVVKLSKAVSVQVETKCKPDRFLFSFHQTNESKKCFESLQMRSYYESNLENNSENL